ncbi:hypothetical protein [Polynucleobacter sp. AP-Reno-20A-A9]|uniref:hypothetical protein n=1 Tax=Polynucleobacter sp. AP-Reno-20A-A9 TaxID=2576925 RepID=UPI001C0B3B01|nr:hypothetical protein [Polynucleobacter sp. AP-Reno-20A-A9]MBU3629272.1 hypothetical protein [Polynucleobacter sp. AP-Reno-20A-A9]
MATTASLQEAINAEELARLCLVACKNAHNAALVLDDPVLIELTGLMVVDQFAKTVLQIADRGYVFSSGKITLEGNAVDLLQSEEMISEYLGEG